MGKSNHTLLPHHFFSVIENGCWRIHTFDTALMLESNTWVTNVRRDVPISSLDLLSSLLVLFLGDGVADYVAKNDLKLFNPPVSQVLRLQVCTPIYTVLKIQFRASHMPSKPPLHQAPLVAWTVIIFKVSFPSRTVDWNSEVQTTTKMLLPKEGEFF